MSENNNRYSEKKDFRINKKIKFELVDGAFNRDSIRSSISNKKLRFNRSILDANNAVAVLDRYDDFVYLKIDSSKYRHTSGMYGIVYDETKHQYDEVIFDHQKQAARGFLRDLRGFGLLADVVGSGKTYEACLVLSELAARDKIKSMLIIVPDQVYSTWKDVLEIQFGLGVGVLKEVGADLSKHKIKSNFEGGFRVLESPIIVKASDFAKWSEHSIDKLLFDVIVYDEAHNLCYDKPEAHNSLYLLSLLMQTKKEAKKTYCILLSATPHSGNLKQMFKLWYFIRCKGGNPKDFKEHAEQGEQYEHSYEYLEEEKIYEKRICRNSITVMEFIANVKRETILESNTMLYFEEMIEILKDSEEFGSLVRVENLDNIDNFRAYTVTVQNKMIEYYFKRANRKNKEEIIRAIASAYHNGVLRTIMIRQPKNAIQKKKKVNNIYFYPTQAKLDVKQINGAYETKVKVDYKNITSDTAVTYDGQKMSITKYCQTVASTDMFLKEQGILAQLYSNMLAELDGIEGSAIFSKKNSISYYVGQFESSLGENESNIIIPVNYTSKEEYEENESFEIKYKKTAEILRNHSNERVLIFFDYELSDKESVIKRFVERITKDSEFNGRVLNLVGKKTLEIEKEFNEKEDAIFVVIDSKFTEGANLQKSSVIINFQVTPDPLSMDQRVGRIFRIGQSSDVNIYSLVDMHKLEGYVLAYYSRIGLLGSNTGDATIIAGCNNERMVAVRCHKCNKVQLLSQDEYDYEMANGGIYCKTSACIEPGAPQGTLMEEISIQNFRCDNPNCGVYFRRSNEDEGYYCVLTPAGGKGIMVNPNASKGSRKFVCRKICAIAHCRYLNDKKDKCAVLRAYKNRKSLFEADIRRICVECISTGNRVCKPGCEAYNPIDSCIGCASSVCKPHKLEFDKNWVSLCPKCDTGHLSLIENSTFANYIRAAYAFNMDDGEAFCNNLANEATKVAEIKLILKNDEVVKRD